MSTAETDKLGDGSATAVVHMQSAGGIEDLFGYVDSRGSLGFGWDGAGGWYAADQREICAHRSIADWYQVAAEIVAENAAALDTDPALDESTRSAIRRDHALAPFPRLAQRIAG